MQPSCMGINTVGNPSASQSDALRSIQAHWLSNIAHDLRGPLFAARGYAKLVLEKRDGDVTVTHSKYLTAVIENIGKVTELVNTLQELPSRDVLELAPLNFTEIVKYVLRDVFNDDL